MQMQDGIVDASNECGKEVNTAQMGRRMRMLNVEVGEAAERRGHRN